MWITKDDCKEGNHAQSHGVAAFEYLYSHVQYTTGPHTHIDDRQNSNINMYIGCEKPGGYDVGSTVEGTVLRFNIIDDNSNWVLFDYPMTASGSFDTITHDWVSIILTVTRHQVHVFVDGAVVEDSTFGFPTDAMGQCQVIRLIGAEGLDRRGPAGSCRRFLGPEVRLAACWNRLGQDTA